MIRAERLADTAEQLMRSRYAAYVQRDGEHLFRTWHPRTRPARVPTRPDVVWLGLRVVRTGLGGIDDAHGVVEFVARYRDGDVEGSLHEVSRFERRAGRWFYLEAAAD